LVIPGEVVASTTTWLPATVFVEGNGTVTGGEPLLTVTVMPGLKALVPVEVATLSRV
jgi:hypothetical protein